MLIAIMLVVVARLYTQDQENQFFNFEDDTRKRNGKASERERKDDLNPLIARKMIYLHED